ncbi:MAG: hypothetical protein QOJ93_388 [Actinomycetota bacterium]|nr:hypothetical protein [Actinomycetota bacterium]
MLEFRWKWAGHVSPQVIRAETMDQILAKVQESWHRDLGVPTASATVMNYIRKLVEEHNHLVPTGPAGESRPALRAATPALRSTLPCEQLHAGRSIVGPEIA